MNLKSITTPKALSLPRSFCQRWRIIQSELIALTAAVERFTRYLRAETLGLPAADGEFEQGADEPTVVIVGAASDLAVSQPFLDVFSGHGRNWHLERVRELAQAQSKLLCVRFAHAGRRFHRQHLVEDLSHSFLRQ